MLRIMGDSLWRALLVAGLLTYATLALGAEPQPPSSTGSAASASFDDPLPKPRKLKLHHYAKHRAAHHRALAKRDPGPRLATDAASAPPSVPALDSPR